MAVTAVRALGFQADKGTSPKCKDKKTLNYPSEDKVALNQKILSLKKRNFFRIKQSLNQRRKCFACSPKDSKHRKS